MSEVATYIRRLAARTGFKRTSFVEKNIPTEASNVVAVPFYGDYRSTFILSSLLLRRYKEHNPDKYVILCSWPGMQGLFPYVDEFWSIDDESITKTLATNANNFYNTSNEAAEITKSLIEAADVVTARDLKSFYDNGFTKKFWQEYGEIKLFLPEVPSANLISPDLKVQLERQGGRQVIVHPVMKMRSWQTGQTTYLPVTKDFWTALIDRLIDSNFKPIIYQNAFTYDVSRDFADRCMYLVPRSVSDVLAAFRYIGCVLDVHSGISRLALAARCPYISVTERRSFIEDKDYELDDLCSKSLPHNYIFSFSTQLMAGGPADWKISVLDNIVAKLNEFLPTLDLKNLPSTSESYKPVSYETVRQLKAKRLGVTFIASSKKK